VIINQHFVNSAFAQDGGAKRLNSLLDGDLDKVLHTLSENLWQAAG
jgi:type I restriction enzyme, R subunit